MLKIANDRYVSILWMECILGVLYFKQHPVVTSLVDSWLFPCYFGCGLFSSFFFFFFLGGGGGGGGGEGIGQYPWRSLDMYI